MQTDVRTFVDQLGGYRKVADRLKKKPTTVHTHMQSGVLPAAWYDALCLMSRELDMTEPNKELFSFLKLNERAR